MESRVTFDAKHLPEYEQKREELLERLGKYQAAVATKVVTENGVEATLDLGTKEALLKWRKSRTLNVVDGKRNVTLGGSELAAALFGTDHFTSRQQLLEKKAYFLATGEDLPDPDKRVSITEWGHVMEPALREYTALYFGTECWDVGVSVVHEKVPWFRHSPDGFALLAVDDRVVIALLEHKNPWARTVKPGLGIPKQYLPQTYSGLDVFRFCEAALFTEANFCCQGLGSWGKSVYNAHVHMMSKLTGKSGKERFNGLVLMDNCMVAFYVPKGLGEKEREELTDIRLRLISGGRGWSDAYETLDVGSFDSTFFDVIMGLHHDGLLRSMTSGFAKMGFEQNTRSRDEVVEEVRGRLGEGDELWGLMAVGLFGFAWAAHEPQKYYVEMRGKEIRTFCERVMSEVESRGGIHESF